MSIRPNCLSAHSVQIEGGKDESGGKAIAQLSPTEHGGGFGDSILANLSRSRNSVDQLLY